MADYIDREALLKDIEESVVFSVRAGHISPEMRGANKITDRIKYAPTADVVEVVRCKDCKLFVEYAEGIQCVEKANGDCYIRMMYSLYKPFCSVTYDDFCSYGKRRDS